MIFEKIQKIIAEELCVAVDRITLQADFMEDLEMDSLDVVEIVMSLEDEFGVEIPDTDIEGIKTVEDLVNYLSNKLDM
ncbi:MAG: acyl carrier protein [Ruminiclostridium sp.]|nr:acyl carrier protein [Ruminiclostridium sp.]